MAAPVKARSIGISEVPSGTMIERLDFTYEYKYKRHDPDAEKHGPS
jgi:hypothetical protein